MSWTIYMFGSGFYVAMHLVNLWLASLGLLQIGFLLALASPAGTFYNFVRELGRGESPRGESEAIRE